MTYEEILAATKDLSVHDRMRLIESLWETIHLNDSPIHTDWQAELEPRVAELQNDSAETIAWNKIRNQALERIDRNGPKHVH